MTALRTIPGPEGRTIAYRRSGSGRAVFLIHGITENSASFGPVQERLAASYDVIAIDMAGHGGSVSPEIVTLAEIAADAAVLLRELSVEAPLLVGHSYGAVVTALLGAEGIGRGLILIDQPLEMSAFRALLQAHRAGLEGAEFKATFKQMMSDLGLGLLAIEEQKELGELHDRADQALVLAQWASTLSDDPEIVEEQIKAILGEIRKPVLSLHGWDEDPAYAKWLKALVREAQVEFWPGAGHWLHIKEAARFCERLRRFDAAL